MASPPIDGSKPIRIGAVYGLTGLANVWSEQARRGIELAVEEANHTGGINGRPIEVIFEDSRSNSATSVSAFTKLVSVNKVSAVIGDMFSFLTVPLIPLANRNKVLLISPSIFDVDLPADSTYFFTTAPRKASIEGPTEKFFEVNPEVKSIGILCADNTWGQAYKDVWIRIAGRRGIKVVASYCTDNFSTDFRAELLKLKSLKPDAVVIPFAIDRALKRKREMQFEAKVLSTSDVVEAVYRRGFPIAEAEGVYFNDWRPGEVFSKAFENRFKTPPIMEPQNSYEAVRAVIAALRSDLENPVNGMKKVKYDGVAGKIDFTDTHAGNLAPARLFEIKGRSIIEIR